MGDEVVGEGEGAEEVAEAARFFHLSTLEQEQAWSDFRVTCNVNFSRSNSASRKSYS